MSKPERIPCRWVVWRKCPETGMKQWLNSTGVWGHNAYVYGPFPLIGPLSEARKDAARHGGTVRVFDYRVKKPGHSTRWARIQLAKGKRVRSLVTGKTVWLDPQFAYVVLIPSRNEWVTRGCMEPSEIAGRWELAE